MSVYGADVAELRATAAELDRSADRLGSTRTELTAQLARTPWTGQDAASFRSAWNSSHAPRLNAAADRLREAAAVLRRNADAQETTSAAAGGSTSSPGAPGASAPAGSPASDSPDDVRDWWTGLSDQQRQDLLTSYPLRYGNLDGIPIEDRVEANRLTAEDRLSQSGLSDAERAYLEAVVRGDRNLALYDPAGERLVEMIGTFGPQTTDVLTYVPGTGTNMDSFYGGGAQTVATYLTDRDKSGGTVSFVYKDGPWADWTFFGEHGTANEGYVLNAGQGLAEFTTAVQSDPALGGDVSFSAAGHSAGISYVSASEVAGAHYDHVLSLAGSWLAPGWQANPGTDYQHYQYGVDALNYLTPVKNMPIENDVFSQHVYAPDTFEILGVTFQNEGQNHTHIAEGPTTNQNALNDMYKDLHR
ncbi:WXG100 family type VII secretion target [Microbacterium rhizomatis]|uniref:WXG100 family type VII secretion target n=1 Tax=Microbacterium rhizomatis TaxID=1631477 RepID=A0A5J5J0S7_9MICO|nr:WXG100 family type VII secretion target [Microbacterium rhizomatis]KAA9106459.1 WXG100 family type VII secretion target [Microbacterium rhizomatis]